MPVTLELDGPYLGLASAEIGVSIIDFAAAVQPEKGEPADSPFAPFAQHAAPEAYALGDGTDSPFSLGSQTKQYTSNPGWSCPAGEDVWVQDGWAYDDP